MKTEKIVMMDSDEAASIQTVTGWVDRQGRFWGKTNTGRAGAALLIASVKTNLMSTLFTALMVIAKNATAKDGSKNSLRWSVESGLVSHWSSLMATSISSTLNRWLITAWKTQSCQVSCS